MNFNPDLNRDPSFDAPRARPAAGNGHATADAPVGTLLRELMHEVPALLSKEVALAKSEARQTLQLTRAGLVAVATGGAVLMAGVIMLMLSAVYGLSLVMQPWLAALLVGAGVSLVGYSLVNAGKKRFEADSLKPHRTMEQLHRNKEVMPGRTSS